MEINQAPISQKFIELSKKIALLFLVTIAIRVGVVLFYALTGSIDFQFQNFGFFYLIRLDTSIEEINKINAISKSMIFGFLALSFLAVDLLMKEFRRKALWIDATIVAIIFLNIQIILFELLVPVFPQLYLGLDIRINYLIIPASLLLLLYYFKYFGQRFIKRDSTTRNH